MARRLTRRSLVVAVACAAWTAPAHAAVTEPSPCTELALSPTFATDQTAACAGTVYGSSHDATAVAVFVTKDKGRTWRRTSAAGVRLSRSDDYVRGLMFSPRYSTDRMLFLQVARAGLFSSTDDGQAFTLVSPFGLGWVTSFVDGVATASNADRVALLHGYVGADLSTRVEPANRLQLPVPGTPGSDRAAVVSPHFRSDGVAFQGAMYNPDGGPVSYPTVYACRPGFVCDDERFRGAKFTDLDQLSMLPAAGSARFVLVVRLIQAGRPQLWRSGDGGRTFRPWASVNSLEAQLKGHGGRRIAVTADPAQPRRLWLRASWSGGTSSKDRPQEQVFASDDAGQTWRRVSYGGVRPDFRRVGTIPETMPAGFTETPPGFIAAGGGRVFILAGGRGSEDLGYTGPYCSTDGGRTWGKFCR